LTFRHLELVEVRQELGAAHPSKKSKISDV
jgi:hypothetical protein